MDGAGVAPFSLEEVFWLVSFLDVSPPASSSSDVGKSVALNPLLAENFPSPVDHDFNV